MPRGIYGENYDTLPGKATTMSMFLLLFISVVKLYT